MLKLQKAAGWKSPVYIPVSYTHLVRGMIEKNMHPEKPMPEEERDLLGEIFSFRNVLLCAIVLGVLLVVINIFAK